MPDVLIHSPYLADSSQGNSVTADRMDGMLRGAGFRVLHSQREYGGQPADVMVALNARKSAKAVARFRYLHPESSLVIILTGTDINHPDILDEKSETSLAMKLADRIVALHEVSMKQVPERFRGKVRVIHPGAELPDGLLHHPADSGFSVIISGNMRREKNPALASAAAEQLPDLITIHHYGVADGLDAPNIIRHGIVPHGEMLRAMAGAHVLLNTSLQEGGSNAVCEAVRMELPVVASAIPGNVGLLGEGYAGLFPSGDTAALVETLEKAASDAEFYALLKSQVSARAPLFSYRREAAAWAELLGSLGN